MKRNKLWIALALTAILLVSLVTCVDQSVAYQQDAKLLYLKIGDVEVPVIPRPVSSGQWDSETFGLAGADFGRASFNSLADTTDKRIIVTVNPGSRAEWGIATRGTKPGSFNDIRVPASFADQDYIYIKVNSNDNTTTNYYRVYTRLKAFVTDLNSISIESRVGKAKGGELAWNTPELEAADISITVGESESALIDAVTFDPNASVEYAFLDKDSTDAPEFTAPDEPLELEDQGFLYVKVTAENTIDKAYFKFRVDVGRMATIKTLKFTGGSKGDKEIFGKGLPKSSWNTVTAGSFSTAKGDQPGNGGFGVFIEADDPASSVTYVKYLKTDSGPPSFPADPTGNPAKIEFASADSLAIRVQSVNGGITNYYRISVTLLAGNITQHPKSAWYMKGQTVRPLTVVLDPPDHGQYSYQWYEADSWYGIYGRHGSALDEKDNISYVNGGPDMYYYLAQPDDLVSPSQKTWQPAGADEPIAWKITGATTNSYTPRNDWENVPIILETQGGTNSKYPYKPNVNYPIANGGPAPNKVNFIAGSTSESRYYWCFITDNDTGLTVTSKRALILTETDPNMQHFIFELSDLPTTNIVPFTKKQEDPYRIQFPANYFPAGFEPSKYEICIAIAQYFLPDGRPWTQNWTHGDIHFGYTEGSASYKANGGPLTWWQNNLGANSGSIPLQAPHSQKGGLLYKPDWVGFTPSGDPGRGLPPLDPSTGELPTGYKPTNGSGSYPPGEAQGYFAGFIELLELRFQAAPTN